MDLYFSAKVDGSEYFIKVVDVPSNLEIDKKYEIVNEDPSITLLKDIVEYDDISFVVPYIDEVDNLELTNDDINPNESYEQSRLTKYLVSLSSKLRESIGISFPYEEDEIEEDDKN
jgi:hypothetical protein